ncbi:hypothetical protein GCM10018980_71120 [Streptomyces capoamus]|uniref:Uncharacterized protein n=1 Tax=Streptomyces capoamus TaxID=68183 RepID=A0A919F361_9ACTN|nr:hypothetical protein GCM10010501_16110 [Streptomyces libani subsp. rufus]GHG74314.1 hypothetical protein GCM10018980_71120 [Streptomyces capoamus]
MVSECQVRRQRQGVQLGLVVEGFHPYGPVFVEVGAGHGVLGLVEGPARTGPVVCGSVDGDLSSQAEGGEHGVTPRDVQSSGDVVSCEGVRRFTSWLLRAPQRFLMAEAPQDPSFIEGAAGAALAFQSVEQGADSVTDWDACLLLI